MSQYPQPYAPPNMPMNYSGMPDPLAPAKRASVLLFILGPIGMLMGTCLFSMPFLMEAAPGPQADQFRQQITDTTHFPPEVFLPTIGALFIVPSLLLLIFAFFVRRGSRGATIASAILVGLIVAYFLINALGSLFRAPLDPKAGVGLCFCVALMSVFVLEFTWLTKALRSSGQASIAQQQYAAQYWQYQQNMQAYAYAQQQQQGYAPPTHTPQGYAIAPPPTTPPPPSTDSENPPTAG